MKLHSTIPALLLATALCAQADERVQKKAVPVAAANLWQLQIGGISG